MQLIPKHLSYTNIRNYLKIIIEILYLIVVDFCTCKQSKQMFVFFFPSFRYVQIFRKKVGKLYEILKDVWDHMLTCEISGYRSMISQ